MKSSECLDEIAAPLPASSELRDWDHLPDLVISDVLSRLVPCVRSLSAFASTCRPWRRFLVASASTILPRIPPLIVQADTFSGRFLGFSPLVISEPVDVPTFRPLAYRSNILASSRGHIILLVRPLESNPLQVIVVVDALTTAKRLVVTAPSDAYNADRYHYAFLTATHLLLFLDCNFRREFYSLPFPTGNAAPDPEWTHHHLPRETALVSAMIDFHGRILGVTDRAELLEFHFHLDADGTTGQAAGDVQLLPTTGLPDDDDATFTFERWQFGPRLVAAGERLLLLLIMTDGPKEHRSIWLANVQKVSLYALDAAEMRWEEMADIGEYSLFVDCQGRSAVACADAAGCGVVANRIYFLLSRFYYCSEHDQPAFQALPPGAFMPDGREGWEWNDLWHKLISYDSKWLGGQTWVYPRLFYGC